MKKVSCLIVFFLIVVSLLQTASFKAAVSVGVYTESSVQNSAQKVLGSIVSTANQINTLIKNSTPLAPIFAQNTTTDKPDNHITVDKHTPTLSNRADLKLSYSTLNGFLAAQYSYDIVREINKSPPGGFWIFYNLISLFLLVYLVALSKSNLPWEIFAYSRRR